MSSQYGGLSIFSLPVLLRNLHALQFARAGHRRAVSTICGFDSIRPSSRRINHRPCAVLGCFTGTPTLSQRFESASTRRRKARASSATRDGDGSNHDSQKSSSPERKKQNKHVSAKAASGDRKKPRKESPEDPPEKPLPQKKPEGWEIQKGALKQKFKEGWHPRKRLSPDTMESVRHLHKTDPERFSTPILAEHFKISPEAIRRILKSKWRPSEGEAESKRQRWERRETRVWDQMAEIGLRPQRTDSDPLSDVKGHKNPRESPDDVTENDQK